MARTWISVKELAERTGVSTTSIYMELESAGEVLGIKALKIRNRWVIPLAPLEKLEEGVA